MRMAMFRITISLLIIYFFSYGSCEDSEQPKVTLKDGTEILGLYDEFHSDQLPVHSKLEMYYGIPYAEPPVGPLRLRPPVPKAKLDSAYNATAIGKSCVQMDPEIVGVPLTNEEFAEDCLFLDVLVPNPRPEKAAILFWIHGGGYTIGSGQMPYTSLKPPVAYGNIIIVTINYRLGPLGFLSTGDHLIPGNFGLLDQQVALRWVQENIEAFGGDPSRVTIAGVSSGSTSVGLHVISPSSAGLFKNAIMQSGSPIDTWAITSSDKDVRLEVKTLAKLFECSPEDIEDDAKLLDCLLAAPAEDFVEQIAKVGEEIGNPAMLPPGPVVDGTFLPNKPMWLMQEGHLNAENYIVGTNAEEGTMFFFMFYPDKDVKPIVNNTMFGIMTATILNETINPRLHDLIKTIYTPDPAVLLDETHNDFFKEASQYMGDKFFMCSESRFARMASETRNVYRYTMTYVPSKNFMDIKWAGSSHGDEGQYVSGAVFEQEHFDESTDEERDMSRMAMQYWINFVKTGNPNQPLASFPVWPKFTKEDELFKDINPSMNNIHMKRRECHFLENVLPALQDAMDELDAFKAKHENPEEQDSEPTQSPGHEEL